MEHARKAMRFYYLSKNVHIKFYHGFLWEEREVGVGRAGV